MWSASTVKVIGSGVDVPDFADKLSRLIGDHDATGVCTPPSSTCAPGTRNPAPERSPVFGRASKVITARAIAKRAPMQSEFGPAA